MKAELVPRASRDLSQAASWIAKGDERAAHAFLTLVDEALEKIGRRPESGALRSQFAEKPYRFWFLRRFNYFLVYNAESSPPRVVRILHTARDLATILRGLDAG